MKTRSSSLAAAAPASLTLAGAASAVSTLNNGGTVNQYWTNASPTCPDDCCEFFAALRGHKKPVMGA